MFGEQHHLVGLNFRGLNAYRRSRPGRRERLATARVYLANEKGRRASSYGQQFYLTKDFIWLDESLTIPLTSVVQCGMTDRCGFIEYHDEMADACVRVQFTYPGFLRPKLKKIRPFIEAIQEQLSRLPQNDASYESEDESEPGYVASHLNGCEVCGAEATVYTFRVLSCVGVAPILYVSRLSEDRYFLCSTHAARQAVRSNGWMMLRGYLGFPGFVVSPYYAIRNLYELKKNNSLSTGTTLLTLLVGIGIPLSLWGALTYWLVTVANN